MGRAVTAEGASGPVRSEATPAVSSATPFEFGFVEWEEEPGRKEKALGERVCALGEGTEVVPAVLWNVRT